MTTTTYPIAFTNIDDMLAWAALKPPSRKACLKKPKKGGAIYSIITDDYFRAEVVVSALPGHYSDTAWYLADGKMILTVEEPSLKYVLKSLDISDDFIEKFNKMTANRPSNEMKIATEGRFSWVEVCCTHQRHNGRNFTFTVNDDTAKVLADNFESKIVSAGYLICEVL